jgi:hypothetical protein
MEEFPMKHYLTAIVLSLVLTLTALPVLADNSAGQSDACWGQATAVFARMGEMGEHASQEPTPRLGLRNLARALAEQGVIPDDSMQALGQFVANTLGLTIEACME